MKKVGDLPPELAPTMRTGARRLPTLSGNEFQSQMRDMYAALVQQAKEQLPPEKQVRLFQDLMAIESGSVSIRELQGILALISHETGAPDAKNASRLLSDRFLKQEMYHDSLQHEMKNLSPATKELLDKKLQRALSKEFRPKVVRLEETILTELPRLEVDYLTKKMDIYFRTETPCFGRGAGASMLPTLPEEECGQFQIPFPIDSCPVVKKGDIVTFVGVTPDNTVGFMTKRIHALQDEVVKNASSGETWMVPKQHCWVLGDNAEQSLDSREFGAVPLANLRSKVVGFYSIRLPRFGWLGDKQHDLVQFLKTIWERKVSSWF